jgi:tRNA A37 threonylcarbamoyladenosine dehydratase
MNRHSEQHKDRLAAALRANLRRRKASAKAVQSRRPAKHEDQVARKEQAPADSPPAGR